MTMWEKLREELARVAQKTEELVKTGAEKLKETGEKIGAQGNFLAALARIKTELHALNQRKNDAFRQLGERYYQLAEERRLGLFEEMASDLIALLQELEEKEQQLLAEKKQLEEEYRARGLEVNAVEALVEDLEAGEAGIESLSIDRQSPALGKALKDLKLPQDVLVSLVVRGEEVVIPRGDTVLQEGDRISLLGKKPALDAARKFFVAPGPEGESDSLE
ncbi:MAG: hypothetical protein D6715_10495 [Calditrichaeota bacterium]|nr:MAG: hypothetical protein D6715_10495 [Calditrichota bacterium]